MALNFDLAYRIPVAGRILSDITGRTREFLAAHQWIGALYCAGIIMMVAVPFLGSGGIRGSITGKLLGIDMGLVYAAIIAGALIGCFGIALTSEALIGGLCITGILPPDISGIVCNRTFP